MKKISVSQRPHRREREKGEAGSMWIGEKGRHRQTERQREGQRDRNCHLQECDFKEKEGNTQKVKEQEWLEYLPVSSSLLRYNKRFLIKGKHYPLLLRVGHLSLGGQRIERSCFYKKLSLYNLSLVFFKKKICFLNGKNLELCHACKLIF